MIRINSLEDLNALVTSIDWADAFVREWYLLSPSYINPDNRGTIAADAAPSMYVLICTPSPECPGIEFFFYKVEDVYFSARTDLYPSAIFKMDHVEFFFQEHDQFDLRAKSIYYQILDKDCWGYKTQYNTKNMFDSGGFMAMEFVNPE